MIGSQDQLSKFQRVTSLMNLGLSEFLFTTVSRCTQRSKAVSSSFLQLWLLAQTWIPDIQNWLLADFSYVDFWSDMIWFHMVRGKQIRLVLFWNNVVFLMPSLWGIRNFTWSIAPFLKATSAEHTGHLAELLGTAHLSLFFDSLEGATVASVASGLIILSCFVRVPKVEREAQHSLHMLSMRAGIKHLIWKPRHTKRKWNKSLAFNCIANRAEAGLSVAFCLNCSESKWYFSCWSMVGLFWCLRLGKSVKQISDFILTLTIYSHYILQVENKTKKSHPHEIFFLVIETGKK